MSIFRVRIFVNPSDGANFRAHPIRFVRRWWMMYRESRKIQRKLDEFMGDWGLHRGMGESYQDFRERVKETLKKGKQ